MKRLIKSFAVWVAALCLAWAAGAAEPRPNVILILVDDLGWTDLSCMGSELYETPNIDRLAAEGMLFRNAYAACTVCSPTRAAVLTGKYPARLHITDWIAGHVRPKAKLKVPDWTMRLPLEEVTIAELLKAEGYATCHIGKWHLGSEGFYPDDQGFDANIGGYHRGQPPQYFAPYNIPTLEEGPEGEYLTDREAAEAERFIRANQERPFFLYLPHYTVHTPIQSKEALQERYAAKVKPGMKQTRADYAAMIESLDESVGRMMAALEELELSNRTAIFFTSDNGGLILGNPPVTDNSPLRSGKGSAYEGGVRVPLIVRWPHEIDLLYDGSNGSYQANGILRLAIYEAGHLGGGVFSQDTDALMGEITQCQPEG
jgi:arylsulfatase A-like enzyme